MCFGGVESAQTEDRGGVSRKQWCPAVQQSGSMVIKRGKRGRWVGGGFIIELHPEPFHSRQDAYGDSLFLQFLFVSLHFLFDPWGSAQLLTHINYSNYRSHEPLGGMGYNLHITLFLAPKPSDPSLQLSKCPLMCIIYACQRAAEWQQRWAENYREHILSLIA